MEISKLGEFGLIDHLTKDIKLKNPSTIKGVGDDCAVLSTSTPLTFKSDETEGEGYSLITTDMLMEGVHFDLTYMDMKHLGYKAAMVNISDIFAMGGTPTQLTVSIALSKRFMVEDLDDFYEGLRMACDKWNVDIVGGDTTSSLTGLAISITCIGVAKKEDIIFRSGAKETDLICVSGDLGAAYMGLQLLEREKTIYYSQLKEGKIKKDEPWNPDFAGREYLIQRQLQSEARGDIIKQLRDADIHPTSMIDISDGLSSEMHHICKASHCGCRIYEKTLPIDYQTAVMAEELNMNVTTCAINGGEDYELLFTCHIGDNEKLQNMEGIKVIGHVVKPELGLKLISRDGNEFDMLAQGWMSNI